MKQAILLQRVHTQEPTVSNGEEALYLATRAGAEYMGVEAGYLAAGRLADLAVVDVSRVHHAPVHRTLAAIVYSSSPADVAYTIVGGDVIVDGGRSALVDEAEVVAEASSHAADMVKQAGLGDLLEPWRTNIEHGLGDVAPARDGEFAHLGSLGEIPRDDDHVRIHL